MEFDCYRKLQNNLEEIRLLADSAAAALSVDSGQRRVGNAMTRAGLVLLSGSLEGFVRDLVEECVDIINDNSLTLESLPDPIFCSVLEKHTAKYRRDERTFKLAVRPESLSRLEKANYSKTGGNPTVDTIEKIFAGLGVPKVIDVLTIRDYSVDTTFLTESLLDANTRSKISAFIEAHAPNTHMDCLEEIVRVIDGKWMPKKKRRKIGYVNEIEQLLAKRNRIAHGESDEQITPADLHGFLLMVGRLATGLCDLSSELLRQLNVDTA